MTALNAHLALTTIAILLASCTTNAQEELEEAQRECWASTERAELLHQERMAEYAEERLRTGNAFLMPPRMPVMTDECWKLSILQDQMQRQNNATIDGPTTSTTVITGTGPDGPITATATTTTW